MRKAPFFGWGREHDRAHRLCHGLPFGLQVLLVSQQGSPELQARRGCDTDRMESLPYVSRRA